MNGRWKGLRPADDISAKKQSVRGTLLLSQKRIRNKPRLGLLQQ